MRALLPIVLCCACSLNRPEPCSPVESRSVMFCVDSMFTGADREAAGEAAAYWSGRSCSSSKISTVAFDGAETPPQECDWAIYRVVSSFEWVDRTTEPNVGGFCDVDLRACWIVVDRVPEFLRAQVFAHEMGHALAQPHNVASR